MEKCPVSGCIKVVYCNGWMKYSYCRDHICDGSNLCDYPKVDGSKYCQRCLDKNNGPVNKEEKKEKKRKWSLCSGISDEEDDRWQNIEYFIEGGNLCGVQSMISALKLHHETSKLPGLKDTILEIKDHQPGAFKTVGFYGEEDDKMPITVDFWWYFINGHKVVFYFPGSILVHWDIIENWLSTNFPQFKENHSSDVFKLYRFAKTKQIDA